MLKERKTQLSSVLPQRIEDQGEARGGFLSRWVILGGAAVLGIIAPPAAGLFAAALTGAHAFVGVSGVIAAVAPAAVGTGAATAAAAAAATGGAAVGAVAGVAAGRAAGAAARVAADAIGGSGRESGAFNLTSTDRFNRHKITVHQAIEEDRKECQNLKAMIEEDLLGKCVVEFSHFCREHRHSVLSSGILEGEFAFLIDILRGTRSHRAARPRPTLLNENVNIQFERVRSDLQQLQLSETTDEASVITQQVLDELQECPSDAELEARFTSFIETKFAEAFAS